MRALKIVLLAAALAVPALHAQQRPTSDPYKGDLTTIFDAPDRARNLQIDRVMDLLHLAPGKNVADLGAGSGWFTVRAAHRVAPSGKVIAEDINPESVAYIENRVKKESLPNVVEVLGTPEDPKLAPGSIDVVMMLKMYHEIAQPVPFMQRVHAALRPGARVAIIDRNGNGSGTDHGIPQATVEKEMAEAGYKKVAKYDFTKADGQDYFLIFEAR